MSDTMSKRSEKLISEAVDPLFDGEASDTPLVVGEPLVPTALVWRGATYPVLKVLSAGKGLGPCTHGSGEQYVHKHWYRFETTDSVVLRVYFERRPRARGKKAKRWWLYSIETPV
jgi:hypothetical protein